MSLFSFRRPVEPLAQKQTLIKTFLAYRDTWTDIPYEGFSMHRIILRDRIEKHKKTMAKLVRSENGFRRVDKTEMTETAIFIRNIQGSLNKLTDQNFETLLPSILVPDLFGEEVLGDFVMRVFQKAVAEPVFSALYARLISRIAHYEKSLPVQDTEQGGKLRRALVIRCQIFFQDFVDQNKNPMDEELEETVRRKSMANIKFVGELYMLNTVTHKVIEHVCDVAFADMNDLKDSSVEMAISLMKVVGKKFDETTDAALKAKIWSPFQSALDNKTLSTRIRFLIQNLLELRAGGWEKSTPVAVQSSSTTTTTQGVQRAVARANPAPDANHGQQNRNWQNTGGNPNYPRQDRHSSNAATMNGSPTGNRHGHRIDGYAPAAAGTATGAGSHSPQSQSPTSGANFPISEISAEEKKMMALATPPQALTKEIEEIYISSIRDSLTDDHWDETQKTIKEALKSANVPSHVGPMCAAFALIKHICMEKSDEERAMFTTVLNNDKVFDSSALSRGFSWFLTFAIVQGLKEDYPKLYTRFHDTLMATNTMTFCVVLRDVLARTANYLDALSTRDDSELEQQEDLVEMWSAVVKNWRERRPEEEVVPATVLEALESVKQRQFMRDIAMDCLAELLNGGFITAEAVKEWLQKVEGANAKTKEAVKVLTQQLTDLTSS